jgi:hypothetical protein
MSGVVDYLFPTNTVLAAHSYLVLVAFDPVANPAQTSAFRAKYGLPADTQILGPYANHLDNKNGRIALSYPDPSKNGTDTAGSFNYVLAEELQYSDLPPWPVSADGLNFSLNRKATAEFADDPANWVAAEPSPGRAASPNSNLSIIQQPASVGVLTSQSFTLRVAAMGQGSIRYQWRQNGAAIPGATNSTYSVSAAQPENSGTYMAVVYSDDASVNSNSAQVTVDTDSDGDGIPDGWEFASGSDPFNATDAQLDPDGDGMTTYQEYIAGTDPRDPQSSFRIDRVSVAGNVTIEFRAMANRVYRIEYAESVTSPVWTTLKDVEAGPEAFQATVTDTNVSSGRYYRLRTAIAR